ncbi:MAG TPA: FTR1 family protein [Candidatus Binataceae bacterium]
MTQTVIPYFLYSSGILIREGLEAMLVVIALAAGTRAAGHANRARSIYAGALAAVVVSIALACVVEHFITDDASDTMEGFFQIFAAATLFYVSSWLTAKSQSDRWLGFIGHKVASAEHSVVPGAALALTAFLAVMREGAETIVFFQALTAGATEVVERHAVMAGLAAGALVLAIAFIVLRRAAHLIPLGAFFSVTSFLLYALAIVFIGQGVASWQEAGVLGATFIDYAPTVAALGIFPTVQSLGAQAILLLFAAGAVVVPRMRRFSVPERAAEPNVRPT